MKTQSFIILLVVAFTISTTVAAQKTDGLSNKKEGKEMMKPGMKNGERKADFLTGEQKEAMQKLHLETAKEMKPLKNELRELQARQQTLTTADNADMNAINTNIDKMAAIKAKIAKILAKQHQAFRSQLTEEQLIKFDSRNGQLKPDMKNQGQRKGPERNREYNRQRGA